jgi:hypothetical protein
MQPAHSGSPWASRLNQLSGGLHAHVTVTFILDNPFYCIVRYNYDQHSKGVSAMKKTAPAKEAITPAQYRAFQEAL